MASPSSSSRMDSVQRPAVVSASSRSSTSTTIPEQPSPPSHALFPVISLPMSSPIPCSTSPAWYLSRPNESIAGVSFSSSPSETTIVLSLRKLRQSPYSQQRAKKVVQQGRISPVFATAVVLIENTLKLESLGVSSRRPEPSTAPKVTLSSRCRPDSKVVFDQLYFADGGDSTGASRKARRSRRHVRGGEGRGSLAGIGEEEGESLQSSIASLPSGDSVILSARSTNTLTSPTSTSSVLPATTNATSFIPESDSHSVTSTSSSTTHSKKPAWSTPRSWADMAGRGGNGSALATGLGTTVSENFDGRSSAGRLPSQTGSPFMLHARRQGQNGRSRGKEDLEPVGLEAIIRQAEDRFSAPLTYPRGMINKGNMCFANAILQMLVYCAPFYNLFRLVGQHVPHDFHNNTPLMEAVICFLSEFQPVPATLQAALKETPSRAIELLREIQASSEPFVPEYLYDAMTLNKRFDTMRRGHQEDAEEFLGFMLDTLHEELLIALHKSNSKMAQTIGERDTQERGSNGHMEGAAREINRPVSSNEGDGWLEVGLKGKTSFTRTTSAAHSPITRIFGGKLRSILRTPGSKDSVTLEPYQPLQLDIQPAHVMTVEEALENLTIPETITGVHSASTKGPVDATKQVFIETLPPVLILHMKRFVYDDIGGVQKSSKVLAYGPTLEISESVVSPARRAEAKRRYKLFGVVYHHGRFASGGHYTIDVLKQDQSEWLHIDDTTWSTVAPPLVQVGSEVGGAAKQHHDGVAYLLFYAREDAVPLLAMSGEKAPALSPSTRHGRMASAASNQSQK